MTATRVRRLIDAPRARVYEALIDPAAVARWKVPAEMTCHVHEFAACEGGALRISLTYDAPEREGKTTGRTDTYHGRFVKLVPGELVVEVDEFETADPALRGEMTITISLSDADGGTQLVAVHDQLPEGVSPAQNELGWQEALARLAALVEDPRRGVARGVRLVDLSHTIESGMTTYPGLPGPLVCDYLSREASREIYAAGTEFHIGKVEMVANTGTYLDSPFHRYADGADIADLELGRLTELDAVVIRAPSTAGRAIDRNAFAHADVDGRAVLVHSGWDAHWRTPRYFEGHPYLTQGAAEHLLERGALLVGIDSLNIDDTSGGERPVHSMLLGAGVPIVEHLRGLEQLPSHGFRFSAVPPKVRGMGTFPVRAYAAVPRAP